MGLNNQVKRAQESRSTRYGMFLENVKYKHMTGDKTFVFRLQPAHDPQDAENPLGWVPFIDEKGALSDWAFIVWVARYVGHGKGDFGTRRDFISLKTFDENADCPLFRLFNAVNTMSEDWGYLVREDKDKKAGRQALSVPGPVLIANIASLEHGDPANMAAVFSKSAMDSLVSQGSGLALRRVARSAGGSYLDRYAVGDLTDPRTGPVLTSKKDTSSKKPYPPYIVELAIDGTTNDVLTAPLSQGALTARYRMDRAETFLNKLTAEELVEGLVAVLCSRAPVTGYHEYALLREVFPEFNVPAPPSAPAGGSMVQSGFIPRGEENPVDRFVAGLQKGTEKAPEYAAEERPAAARKAPGLASALAAASGSDEDEPSGQGAEAPLPGEGVTKAQLAEFMNRLQKSAGAK